MNNLHLYNLGKVEYLQAFNEQKRFVDQRQVDTVDEIWCLEHPPVYTLGLSGNAEHVLDNGAIPVVHTDRGGQVTYHGPGQLVAYPLLDLKRKDISVKKYVHLLEQILIDTVSTFNISAHRIQGSPGIYVDNKKLAALGIRIRHGYCYHGISLNINMDLSPFNGINPCGHEGLQVTQLIDLGVKPHMGKIIDALASAFVNNLGYDRYIPVDNVDRAGLNVI